MKQSIAVVIGASGGVGSALFECLQYSERFDEVVGLGRRTSPELDLLSEQSIEDCAGWLGLLGADVRLVFDATGVLTVDGQRPERSWREIDPETLARAYAVNAIGPALLMKHFLPLLPREGRSVFATLSARVGSIGDNRSGGWYAYRASKAGLNQMVRCFSVELARTKPEAICVALHPGTVRTRLTERYAKVGLDVQEPKLAAQRLISVLNSLSPEQSGGFFDHHGSPVDW